MRRMGFWIGALGLVVSAALLAACGGGGDGEPAAVVEQVEQAERVEAAHRRLGCR